MKVIFMDYLKKFFLILTLIIPMSGCVQNKTTSSTSEPILDLTEDEAIEALEKLGNDYDETISTEEFYKLNTDEIEELIVIDDMRKFFRVSSETSTDNVTMYQDHSMLFNSGNSYCWTIANDELRIGSLQGSCEVSKGYGVAYEIYHLSGNAYMFRLMVSGQKELTNPQGELWVIATSDNVKYSTNS